MQKTTRFIPLVAIAIVVSSFGVGSSALAHNLSASSTASVWERTHMRFGNNMRNASSTSATSTKSDKHRSKFFQGVRGTVSAINGTILTVKSKNGTTYTVEASIAKIVKNAATSTIEVTDIKVGDIVMIEGTVSGTTVSAKKIIDADRVEHDKKRGFRRHGTTTSTDM